MSKTDLALFLGAAGLLTSLLGWITTVLPACLGPLAALIAVAILATAVLTAPVAIYCDRRRASRR